MHTDHVEATSLDLLKVLAAAGAGIRSYGSYIEIPAMYICMHACTDVCMHHAYIYTCICSRLLHVYLHACCFTYRFRTPSITHLKCTSKWNLQIFQPPYYKLPNYPRGSRYYIRAMVKTSYIEPSSPTVETRYNPSTKALYYKYF